MAQQDISGLIETIAQLQRDVAELKQAGVGGAIPRGAALVVVDSSGNEIARLGRTADNTDDVVTLGSVGAAMYWSRQFGIEKPYEHVAGYSLIANPVPITSGTYLPAISWSPEYAQTQPIKVQVAVDIPVGTTGTMRVTNTGSAAISTTRALLSGTYLFHVLHWNDLSKVLYTGPHKYDLEVKRDSGAGTINVYCGIFSMGTYSPFDPGNLGTWS